MNCLHRVAESFKDDGLTVEIMRGLPSPLCGLKSGMVQRMRYYGIIERDRTVHGPKTIWKPGCNYRAILKYLEVKE